jgi:hypothetical protein
MQELIEFVNNKFKKDGILNYDRIFFDNILSSVKIYYSTIFNFFSTMIL